MGRAIGIDLGTTFCAVAVIENGEPKVIENGEGNKTTPSVIKFDNGDIIFGEEAKDSFIAGDKNCAAFFKRNMGEKQAFVYDGATFKNGGKDLTAEDLQSLLLAHIKQDTESVLGEKISEAVITVPAYFYSEQRMATKRAAENAGLKVRDIISEPKAAALAYGLNNWRANARILVYDLGGGTFDVTLVVMGENGELISKATDGERFLGGKDWDKELENIITQKINLETGVDTLDNPKFQAKIKGMCERCKKSLSGVQTWVEKMTITGYGDYELKVTREAFEKATKETLEKTGRCCEKVLLDENIGWSDITDVLLVGGSTRMPQVFEYIQGFSGKPPIKHMNPDEAVALGAAIQTLASEPKRVLVLPESEREALRKAEKASLAGKEIGEKKTVPLRQYVEKNAGGDITPHQLGVIAINAERTEYINEMLIPENYQTPVSFAKRFMVYTQKGDNELEIFVLQGKGKPLECEIPYKYVVKGIRHDKSGEAILRIMYSYDKFGIIRVQARQGDDNYDLKIEKKPLPSPLEMMKYGKTPEKSKLKSDVPYKIVTFSNTEWETYDNISKAEHLKDITKGYPLRKHIIKSDKNIKFVGYNSSSMDEGVFITLDKNSTFEIECNINTSTIQEHPGGHVNIELGIIKAQLTQHGGNILLDGQTVKNVGSKFNIKMSLKNGRVYEVYINNNLVGSKEKELNVIKAKFGLEHSSHDCVKISEAEISNIHMAVGEGESDSQTEPWEMSMD